MNRSIDKQRMNQSKERTMDFVLNTINKEPRPSFLTRSRSMVITSLIVITALVVMLSTPNSTSNTPITISAYESEKIAEISYITSSIIGSNLTVSNTNTMLLSYEDVLVDDTEFENNDELINLYFDTLRVFLEDDIFEESINVTVSEENPNIQTITYTILGIEYILTITFDGETFSGTLQVEDVIYQVTGEFEETNEELKLVIEAVNGNDYVTITFISEQEENELEKKYEVKQRINNMESEKEIKVSLEEDEESVEIKDGDNEYKLKKEVEDGQLQYKLEYKINGTEGEAVITESEDTNGSVIYSYQIKEGNEEKEIEHGKPDYDYDDDDDEEDEEDEEDDEGNGNQNNDGKNQSNINTDQLKRIFMI